MAKREGTCGAVGCHSLSVDAVFCLVLGRCFGACFSWLKSSLCPKASASLLPTVLCTSRNGGSGYLCGGGKNSTLLKQIFNVFISSLLSFGKFLYFY